MSAHSLAHELKAYVNGAIAWNMPAAIKAQVVRKTVNQWGTSYRFTDGSIAFITTGTAGVRAQA